MQITLDVNNSAKPATLVDEFGFQTGTPDNPLSISGGVVKVAASQWNTFVDLGTGSGGSPQRGLVYNDDGTGGGIYCTPTVNGFVALWVPFYGRVFGIRVAYGAPALSVSIDGGAAIRVNDLDTYVVKENRVSGASNHAVHVITHTDLEDGVKHYARVEIAPSASATTFFGYLLDSKYYQNETPGVFQAKPLAVPLEAASTGATFTPYSALMSASYGFVKISKLVYANPTAGALELYWYDGTTKVLTKTIAAKDTWSESFNPPLTASSITHAASGSGMYVTAFGGYY